MVKENGLSSGWNMYQLNGLFNVRWILQFINVTFVILPASD